MLSEFLPLSELGLLGMPVGRDPALLEQDAELHC